MSCRRPGRRRPGSKVFPGLSGPTWRSSERQSRTFSFDPWANWCRDKPSLPQRLQNLHQFGVDVFIAADHVAGLERVVVAIDAADDAAGFAHDDLPCRHVPWLQIAFPIAVE